MLVCACKITVFKNSINVLIYRVYVYLFFQIIKCSKLTTSKRPLSAFCVVKCGGQERSSNTVTQRDGKDHSFSVSILVLY